MDAAIKKLVSGRLMAQATGKHPDAELLAAYAENSLSGNDRASLLNHLAACMDCRDTLYLAMPEADERVAVAPVYRPRRWGMRWATLTASVVILGAALLTDRGLFNHQSSSAAPRASIAESKDQPAAEIKEQPAAGLRDKRAGSPTAAPPALDVEAEAKTRPAAKHMTAKPQASMQFDQSGQVHLSTPLAGADVNRVSAGRSAEVGAMIARPAWSLSSDGNVQRSLDSGATWQVVPVGEGLRFRAIGSFGNDVWVGGSAGSLYHSVNAGESWTKLPAISEDDITRIEFSDQQNGVLETAKGHVWSTSDGGQSWRSK